MGIDAVSELDELNLREVLDADSRPTFVIDLDPDQEAPEGTRKRISPVFCNAALRLHERLFDNVIQPEAQGSGSSLIPDQEVNSELEEEKQTPYDAFKSWATGVTPHDDSKDVFPLSFLYGDILWTGSTVRRRWRLISGNHLWQVGEAHQPCDLSHGVPPEVATGGVHAEQKEPSLEKPIEIVIPTATLAVTSAASPIPSPILRAAAVVTPNSISTHPQDTSSLTGTTTLVSSKQDQTTKPYVYPDTAAGSSEETKESSNTTGSIVLSLPDKAVTDWTAAEPVGVLSPHLEHARNIDWSQTSLGPMDQWTPEFRQLANICMGNPHPAAIFWGGELTLLYNEAYAAEVAGNKHPSLMGTTFATPFAELSDYAIPVYAECARTGISVRKEDDYLPINRRNLLEETYWAWSFTPVYGGTNRIQGFYNCAFETTDKILSRRRLHTINQIGKLTSDAKTRKQFWQMLLGAFDDNQNDFPFVLLYSVGDLEEADHSSVSSNSTISLKTCYLEGTVGVPEGHIAAPKTLDLKRSREGFVPSFREAMRTREPMLLHTRDGTLPEALLEGIEWRGFGEPCKEAVILPARPTNGDAVLGFVVLGVNPRRPYSDRYRTFTSMMHRQLATSLASVILFEEEVRRNRDAAEAAAMEKEQLTEQLALQDDRLRRMTEFSPLGMFLINPDGVLREANNRFYEMTGLARDVQYEKSWMDFILESSIPTMDEGWQVLVRDHAPWTGELQLKKLSANPVNLHGEAIDYWVLFVAHSDFTPEGALRSVMGSIMDISHHKWAQGLQNRRLQEAEETRRQQNEFIDITSHEIRNPLSAVLQCAEDISSALEKYRTDSSSPPPHIVESCVEAAQTIALCVQHQKSIVDDILTVSKLDSNLLLISPSAVQPDAVLQRAWQMFEHEIQAKGIEIVYDRHPSYETLNVDWVMMDPSRVLQILVNLLSNAIKFTAPARRQVITLSISASQLPPDRNNSGEGFEYVPTKSGATQVTTTSEDWGPGELLYLHFKVQDTGCGLTSEEKQILFQRFKQASPRTHTQYGGSGLGLFISKHLTELHGGQIGVASEAGAGSVFALYIQARRTDPPAGMSPIVATPIQWPSIGEELLKQVAASENQDEVDMASSAAKLDTPKVATVPQPEGLDILVVEDNLINQKVLVGQLRKAGHNVNAANDGVEALQYLEKTHLRKENGDGLSIILMDLEMPNMDGLTCVRKIRRMEEEGRIIKHIPVIAVTANVRDEQVTSAKMSGMDDVVSKPFRIPDLLRKIKGLIRT